MAKVDVFNTNQTFQGSFHVRNNRVRFGGQSGDHLVQSIQYNFTQQISMLYELGAVNNGDAGGVGQNVYYAGGRASGQANLSRIVARRGGGAGDVMISTYHDICKPNNIEVAQLASLCNHTSTSTATAVSDTTILESAVLVSIAGVQDVNSAVFTEQMGFMYLNQIKDDNAA